MIKVLVPDKFASEWYRYFCSCRAILVVSCDSVPPESTFNHPKWLRDVKKWQAKGISCPCCGLPLDCQLNQYKPCTEAGVLI